MKDSFNREVNYLRLSITDKCNLRCKYCMPQTHNTFLKTKDLISTKDIQNIVKGLSKLGITKVKLTGGEPLLRDDFGHILKVINESIEEITLTTNGVFIYKYIDEITKYITSINISLDTINKQYFQEITKRDELDQTLKSIKLAVSKNISNIKINTVPLKEYGENNIYELVEFSQNYNLPIRFIEMMPIGLGKNYKSYSFKEMITILERKYGKSKKINKKLGNGPATYFEFEKLKINIGFILAISNKFCEDCNKVRVTSNGYLKSCLHYKDNINIKKLLTNYTEEDLQILKEFIFNKPEAHRFLEEVNKKEFEDKTMSFIGG